MRAALYVGPPLGAWHFSRLREAGIDVTLLEDKPIEDRLAGHRRYLLEGPQLPFVPLDTRPLNVTFVQVFGQTAAHALVGFAPEEGEAPYVDCHNGEGNG